MGSLSRAAYRRIKGLSNLMKVEIITTFMIFTQTRFNLLMFQKTLLQAMMPSPSLLCSQAIKGATQAIGL
jgi:hypothetical protein